MKVNIIFRDLTGVQLNCIPGELYIVIMHSVPSPSKMLIRGASLLIFLAQSGLAGGINNPEQNSPAGTTYALGLRSHVSYWLHWKVWARGGGGGLQHPSVTRELICRTRENFYICKWNILKIFLTMQKTRKEKSATSAMFTASLTTANCAWEGRRLRNTIFAPTPDLDLHGLLGWNLIIFQQVCLHIEKDLCGLFIVAKLTRNLISFNSWNPESNKSFNITGYIHVHKCKS